MSGNKRYYWLKLNENFFEDDTITWIEEQENGKDYIVFYLKLCLRSLTDDGYLIRYVGEKLIPYDVRALSKLTNTDYDTVKVAMNLFLEVGIISLLDSGELYLNQINEMIGSETESAKRVRKHRLKQGTLQSNKLPLQSNSDVILSNTEIEKEKELDKEIEIDKEPKKKERPLLTDLKNDFEKLWSLYPNKKSKPRAFTAYKRAIKNGVTNKEIQDGILSYKKEIEIKGTDKQFIKHGGTWFNNQGWEDDYDHEPPKKNYRKGSNYNEIIPEWVNKTDEPMQEEPTENKETIDEEELRRRLDELMGEDDDVQDNG